MNLPRFRLPDDRGGSGGTDDVFQEQDVVLALLHGGCRRCAALEAALGRASQEVRALGAVAFAISPGHGAPAPAAEPLRRLVDARGDVSAEIATRVGARPGEARLVVADRYGEVFAALPAHGLDGEGDRAGQAGQAETLVREALDWLHFVQVQCPECGAPSW